MFTVVQPSLGGCTAVCPSVAATSVPGAGSSDRVVK